MAMFVPCDGCSKEEIQINHAIFFNTAKALILKRWKSKKIPMTKIWFREIDKLRLMEEVTHSHNESEIRFASTWKGWLDFKNPWYM